MAARRQTAGRKTAKTAKRAAKKTAKRAAKKTAKRAGKKTAKRAGKKTAKRAAKKTASRKTAKRAAKKTAKRAAKRAAKKTASRKTAKRAAKKTAKRAAKKTASRKTAKRAAKKTAKRAAKKAPKRAAKKTPKRAAKKTPKHAAKGTAKMMPASPAAAKAPEPAEKTASFAGVREGAAAPGFELPDANGRSVSSAGLRGEPFVLYFYPRDDTPGCTTEACGFRDSLNRFAANGVRIIGVSPDSEASHQRFIEKYGLNFTLLSDQEKTVAQAYGVWVKKQNYGREYMGIERSTFLIDGAGVVRRAWRGVRVPGHVDEVLAEAARLG